MNAGNAISRPRTGTAWFKAAETKTQLGRFVVVGLICVSVDLTLYSLLSTQAAWPLDAAKGLGYLCGIGVGFVLNKLWTFRSARRSLAEPALYLGLYLITLSVNVGCNRAVLWTLGPTQTVIAFLVATGLTTLLNFIGLRCVTFRRGVAERHQALSPAARRAA